MRAVDTKAFGDFAGHQVAMLETAFARPALDVEISPPRPLVPMRRAQPFLLVLRKAGPMKAGLGERKTSETK